MYVEDLDDALDFARALKRKARALSGIDLALAAPAPFIAPLSAALKSSSVRVGAQYVSYTSGAHTGEVSAAMARAAGAEFCLVGHSERRADGDTNERVREQFAAAAAAGLAPVLCVGETERLEDGSHVGVIESQLREALRGSQSLAKKLVVAYEPVWAIGGGASRAMPASEVREMAIFIRKVLADILGRAAALRVPVLYGGSVESENAAALMTEGGIAGLLVGHTSADITQFLDIARACSN